MMFELMNALETARNINNGFLRWCVEKYTKFRLKKVFFEKFDINNIDLNIRFIHEFYRFYDCICNDIWVNDKFPYICNINTDREIIRIKYYNFTIRIKFHFDHQDYSMNIIDSDNDYKVISTHSGIGTNEWSNIKEIFLISIYNFCVAYVYGPQSDLYMDNKSYVEYLKDLF